MADHVPCKGLVGLSPFFVTEVYEVILKEKQSFALIRNLILPTNLDLFHATGVLLTSHSVSHGDSFHW